MSHEEETENIMFQYVTVNDNYICDEDPEYTLNTGKSSLNKFEIVN
eukprot:CAMPEP_0116893570 /NCGR_PEP_ID=MMETSP0467-20121206/3524_1 /TAXON_ID=283647 /ORGANISM="Mesodinium pulex, Strain SPMC105" /LENGTH=45 /DNA_ID= /DNA_START= /DNA_END= /DNA_ORIENTATION=